MCKGSNEARRMRNAKQNDQVVLSRGIPALHGHGHVVGFVNPDEPNIAVCCKSGKKITLMVDQPFDPAVVRYIRGYGVDLVGEFVGKRVTVDFHESAEDYILYQNKAGQSIYIDISYFPTGTKAVIDPVREPIEKKLGLVQRVLRGVGLDETNPYREVRYEDRSKRDMVDGDD